MNNYIYLIYPIRFLEQNEPTYKIGKTTTNVCEYLNKKYLKTSKVIFTSEVINCHKLEKEIINLFDKIFVKRKDVGLEYYTGNVDDMKEIIMSLVKKEKHVAKALYNLPKVIQYVKAKQEYIKTLSEHTLDEISESDNIDEISESDNIDEISDSDNIDEISEINNIDNNNESNEIKNIKTFCKYIYDTKPTWYKPGEFVNVKYIENFYNEYFHEKNTYPPSISKLLKNKVFDKGKRVKGITMKKLLPYTILRTKF